MTVEHLCPLLDSVTDQQWLFKLAEQVAQGRITPTVIEAIRMGRMTALRKANGGVRGIVVGDVVRRLVARTMAQQLGPQVESAMAPFQYALSTRGGSECVAYVIQGLSELNPDSTVMSIDGISAYDQISRAAMLDGLYTHCGGETIPFVRMFHGSPSTYVWEDAEGVEHFILQGEGGEQADPLMPLLYSLGQHGALEATQEELADGENLVAYFDDIWVVSPVPETVSHVYGSLQRNLFSHARIRVHGGKTQVWNRSGIRPEGCDALERIAQAADPRARVWRGSGETDLPPSQQGIVVLGTPLGDPAFIQAHLDKKADEQRTLLERIPMVTDLQSAWLILLHCASARANCLLRVVEPQSVAAYSRAHDEGVWTCMCALLNINPTQDEDIRSCANLPLVLGGVGLRSATRTSVSAYWASWADCLPMMFARHPEVASQIVQQLEGHPDSPFLAAAASSARVLSGTMGFDPPSWQALCEGVRPRMLEPDEFEPGIERGGWQHEASSRVERQHRKKCSSKRLLPRDRAWVRSQSGPGGSLALTTCPTSALTKIPPHLFRVVLLRRLRLPLPLSPHTCGCGSQSTRLATTALRAPGRGHWGGGDSLSRVLRAYVGRQGDG